MKKIRFESDISCSSCEISIKKVLKNKVDEVVVNIPLQLIDVTFDENKISKEQIVKDIKSVGYEAVEIN